MELVHPVRRRSQRLASTSIELRYLEADPALGSGGLSDDWPHASWTAWRHSGIPAYGYGIRYEHGLFKQQIRDGQQYEVSDDWLENGNPWEIEHRQAEVPIRFGGTGGQRRRQ